MTLSQADLERAANAAAAAPELTAGQRDQLRALLAGCTPTARPETPASEPDATADDGRAA